MSCSATIPIYPTIEPNGVGYIEEWIGALVEPISDDEIPDNRLLVLLYSIRIRTHSPLDSANVSYRIYSLYNISQRYTTREQF